MKYLYTKMKIFKFTEKIESLPKEVNDILPPIHIRIKPTNICVHNCRYCAYRSDNLQLGKDMNTRDYIPHEKMMEIVDDISTMGVKAVTFSGGGDPFYYPYLLDTIKRLDTTGIKFASLTNGARLSGEIADIFAHRGTWLRISIDGWDDDSYSRYRDVPHGEFTKVIKNMEDFKKIGGGCYLGVSIIVDRDNAGRLYDFIKRLKDTGANSVKVSPCIVSNDASENNLYHQPVFNMAKVGIEKAIIDFLDEGFEVVNTYHLLEDKFKKNYDWCPYLQILPVIGADLNIYSCQDKAYNISDGMIGSIKNQRFKDFWFSGKEKFYKVNPSDICNHHCVSNEKNKMIMEYLYADPGHLEFV